MNNPRNQLSHSDLSVSIRTAIDLDLPIAISLGRVPCSGADRSGIDQTRRASSEEQDGTADRCYFQKTPERRRTLPLAWRTIRGSTNAAPCSGTTAEVLLNGRRQPDDEPRANQGRCARRTAPCPRGRALPGRPARPEEHRRRCSGLRRSEVHVERPPSDSRSRGFVGNTRPHGSRRACTAGPEGTGTRRVRRRRDEVAARTGTRVRNRFPATALPGEGERSAPRDHRVTDNP